MRPATPLICAFIDEHKVAYGVVPICRALAVHGVQIAPRTYWAHRLAAAPSKRALWDITITEILAGIYEPDADGKRPPESLVRQPEDVGAPAASGHPGGAAHGGTDHAAQRLAWGHARSSHAAHHRAAIRALPGRRIWWAGGGGLPHRTCWRWPTSATSR